MTVLSDDDWQFIEKTGNKFPHLKPNFERAILVPSAMRLGWAENELRSVPRSGYVVRGIPAQEAESVREHTDSCVELAKVWTLNSDIQTQLRVHDVPEAIIYDFHWKDPISKEEKRRLENIAAKIIFENEPEGLEIYYNEFLDQESLHAKTARDIDVVQVLFKTLEYYLKYPQLAPKLDEFWSNTASIFLTNTGKEMYQHVHMMRQKSESIPHLDPL